ncbi:MAG: lamin tail domain-containing protein, partial [Candidatus Izemoplasmatales bacterium]
SLQTWLQGVADAYVIDDLTGIEGDFYLPAEIGDVTISWSTSNSAIISVATGASLHEAGLYYLATVTRPNAGQNNSIVLISAVFHFGELTVTRSFTATVLAQTIEVNNSIFLAHANATVDGTVSVSGVVYGLYKYGYFLVDDTGSFISVYYSAASTTNLPNVVVGDKVSLTGTYAQYHNLYQLKDPSVYTFVSSGNDVDVTPVVLTDATDILSLSTTDKYLNGQVYTVTATLTQQAQGTYTNFYLVYQDTRVATIYYNSPAASLAALLPYVGQVVTLNLIYYTYYEDGSSLLETGVPEFWFVFEGSDEDIQASGMTDEAKLAIDLAKIAESGNVLETYALPEFSFATVSNVVIATELENNLTYNAGAFTVTRPTEDLTGTVTITLTVGEVSDDVVVTLTLKANSTSTTTGDDLFFSQYVEGTSYNKYLEIFNPTGQTVDLSEYTIEIYQQKDVAATTPLVVELSGSLAAGDVIVYGNSGGTIFTPDVFNNTICNFNGNDILVLKHNGVVIDSIGQVGILTVFSADVTLIRKSSISAGDTDPFDVYDVASQWDTYSVDSAEGLGSHTMD